jgi:hypothetical protein
VRRTVKIWRRGSDDNKEVRKRSRKVVMGMNSDEKQLQERTG